MITISSATLHTSYLLSRRAHEPRLQTVREQNTHQRGPPLLHPAAPQVEVQRQAESVEEDFGHSYSESCAYGHRLDEEHADERAPPPLGHEGVGEHLDLDISLRFDPDPVTLSNHNLYL